MKKFLVVLLMLLVAGNVDAKQVCGLAQVSGATYSVANVICTNVNGAAYEAQLNGGRSYGCVTVSDNTDLNLAEVETVCTTYAVMGCYSGSYWQRSGGRCIFCPEGSTNDFAVGHQESVCYCDDLAQYFVDGVCESCPSGATRSNWQSNSCGMCGDGGYPAWTIDFSAGVTNNVATLRGRCVCPNNYYNNGSACVPCPGGGYRYSGRLLGGFLDESLQDCFITGEGYDESGTFVVDDDIIHADYATGVVCNDGRPDTQASVGATIQCLLPNVGPNTDVGFFEWGDGLCYHD